jgi:hypothetical protein
VLLAGIFSFSCQRFSGFGWLKQTEHFFEHAHYGHNIFFIVGIALVCYNEEEELLCYYLVPRGTLLGGEVKDMNIRSHE